MIETDFSDPSPVVVTGQQAGLFGGPLYTLYKLLGACAVAADRGARPVFWIECDDADIVEVDQAGVLDAGGNPIALTTAEADDGRPVAARRLGDGTVAALSELQELAAASEAATAAATAVAAAYRPGRPWHHGFRDYLASLVPTTAISFLDPSTVEFKRATQQLVGRVLTEADAIETALLAGSREVESPQVPFQPGQLPLFVLDDDGVRRKLIRHGADFELKGSGQVLSLNAALDSLAESPERFSPAVLLRPLVQDSVLNTVAYIAGPSERRYHSQLGPLYQLLDVRRPEVIERPSFTLLDARTRRSLERLGATPEQARGGAQALTASAVRAATGIDPTARAAETLAILEAELERLRAELSPIDPNPIDKGFDDVRKKLAHNLTKVGQRAQDLLARKQTETSNRAQVVANFVCPNGQPQERVFCPYQPLTTISAADLVAVLLDRIDPKNPGQHQFVEI